MKKTNYKSNSEFIVDGNSLLLEYLFLKLSDNSKKSVKSLLLHGNITVDGKTTTKYDYKLISGQKVVIKRAQIHNQSHNEVLDIIYEDDDMIVINKPAGLLSISTDNDKENTAYHMVMSYLRRNNYKSRIFVVHRIDRDTSGVLLIAKKEQIKFALQDNWSNIVSTRGYIAIVEGKLKEPNGTIKSWLLETKTLLVYSSKNVGDGQEAITHYQKLKENEKYTLLDIRIDTGRKNQIRVHMKDIGHNIIGDKKYGAKSDPIKRLGLHAHILEFKHPITNKMMRFEAEIPNEFLSLFKY